MAFFEKVIILCLDGLPYALLERFALKWELGNFIKLKSQSSWAKGLVAPPPDATTPPAFACLFCGCPAVVHNIVSFEEPEVVYGGIHPWKKVLGFNARNLKAEPLWVSFLKAGKCVVMLHFPLSVPIAPYTEEKLFGKDFSEALIVFESFSQNLASELVVKAGDVGEKIKIKTKSGEELELSPNLSTSFQPVIFEEKQAGVYVVHLAGEADSERIFITNLNRVFCNHKELAEKYLDFAGPFVGNAGVFSYWKGLLGKPVYEGGSGKAEEMLRSLLGLVGRHFYRAVEFALEKLSADVYFLYYPGIDLVLHLFTGWLDEQNPQSSPEIKEKLWQVVEEMFKWADKIVGLCLERAGEGSLLAVVSDHGMAPVFSTFYPNQVLLERGLLFWDEKNSMPELDRSQAIYHQSNSGYIVINTKARGGIVEDEKAGELARKVASIFEEYVGEILQEVVLVSESKDIPYRGEIYLVPRYRIGFSHKVEGKIYQKGTYAGQHHYWQEAEPMWAVLFLKGKSIPLGKELKRCSHLDVAPTLAQLCDIPTPSKSVAQPINF